MNKAIPVAFFRRLRSLLIAGLISLPLSVPARTIYVAPNGNAAWSGRLSAPNADRTDGPLPSLEGARDHLRALRSTGIAPESFEIQLRGGTYHLAATFVLESADSGTRDHPVVYAAYPGETPVISGGTVVRDWKRLAELPTAIVDDRPGAARATKNLWSATLARPSDAALLPRQLFINGARTRRARAPNVDFFRIPGLTSIEPNFKLPFMTGEIPASWANSGAEVVALLNWTFMRQPIIAVDTDRNVATLGGNSGILDASITNKPTVVHIQSEEARYYIENTRDALDSDTEWFYDAGTGQLLYWPKPSEDLNKDEVVVSRLITLVRLTADAAAGKYVRNVTFRGLTFAYANWDLGPNGFTDKPQAAVRVPAAFEADGARECVVEQCTFTHLGGYGIAFLGGAIDNRILHNQVFDVGAGGIKLGVFNSEPKKHQLDQSSGNIISDNHIHHIGEVHPSGVGILVGQSGNNTISHNLIHDTYYSAISVGWTWGYDPNPAKGNTIEYNRLHHIMRGRLDDGGGIYMLGQSLGTVIRHNVIHDIQSSHSRGRGIYLDEGSTDMLVENNLVYRVKSAAFHVHYGRNNTVRNNIFALCDEFQITRPRVEPGHHLLTFEHNIVYFDSGRLLGRSDADEGLSFNRNLYYDTRGEPLRFIRDSWEQWRSRGHDKDSLIADPRFANPAQGDFSFLSDSPAKKIGFKPFDFSKAGPRSADQSSHATQAGR